MQRDKEFAGPIFVVGMPRSGTKLLRDLLNNHSQIGMTPNESHFIPYYREHIRKFGDLGVFENFQRFYREFSRSVFFQRVTADHPFIDAQKWHDAVRDWSYAGVVEAFYRLYAESLGKRIWGDKTPYYHLHMPLLKSLFPSARFVHIIRDARDYCLSLNKSWKKNIYRSVQRWNDTILKARKDAETLPPDAYLEVRYEALVDQPQETLAEICNFLGVDFEPAMVMLKKRTENLGDARDIVGIVGQNYGKWRQRLGVKEIAKIEQICTPLLTDLGYAVTYAGEPKRLSGPQMFFYKIADTLNLVKFEITHNHLKDGLANVFKARKYLRYRAANES